jgi:DNA mismatch repair protein MLH1
MKRALEAAYSGILPKGASPFVYLRFVFVLIQSCWRWLIVDSCSLQIDPRSVDVNVHPTKRQVHFLNEEAIAERISDALQCALVGQSQSKTFEYQVGAHTVHFLIHQNLRADGLSVRPC